MLHSYAIIQLTLKTKQSTLPTLSQSFPVEMAPTKKIQAEPAFYKEDVMTIMDSYAEDDASPTEGESTELEVDGKFFRRYKYVDGFWKYISAFRNEEKNGKTVEIPLTDDGEEKPKAKRAPKKKEPEEKSETEAELEADPVKISKEEPVEKKEPAEKKERKPRAAVTLNDVMAALENMKIDEAKKKLKDFIEKNGAEGKAKRQRKAVDPDAPPKEKKKTALSEFLSVELKRIAEEEKLKDPSERMKPTERMKVATKNWAALKAKKAAEAADE